MTSWILLTIVAVAFLLLAEYRGSRVGIWTWKPIASTGFVATALAGGATATPHGCWVLAALVLSWWGDVLLIPRARRVFLLGIASFLLGHVAFACGFLSRGVSLPVSAATALLLVIPARLVLRWLAPHVTGELRVAVRAYVVVICTMVACAVGTYASAGGAGLLIGALMFFVSDLAVARERFVDHGFANKTWGLPLYYGGQLLLAASVTAP
ncbi:MAG: lysoplasmalogenase [Deltaproteobacteria bacterium]|nr:lysoplasmalogenase [Deltaproteobacteria bacterium]